MGKKAFPLHTQSGNLTQQGMDLRDYFAAKAMQAWLSNAERAEDGFDDDCLFEAKLAYRMADAMMKARGE